MEAPHRSEAGGSAGNAETTIPDPAPLADRINAYHHAAESHAGQVLANARAAGELLLEAKNTVLHGEWLPWLEVNFDGSQRTAHAYMRVARQWPQIEAAVNPQWTADLTLHEALQLARYGYGHKAHKKTDEGRA